MNVTIIDLPKNLSMLELGISLACEYRKLPEPQLTPIEKLCLQGTEFVKTHLILKDHDISALPDILFFSRPKIAILRN